MSEIKSDNEPKSFDAKKILEKLTPEQKNVLHKLLLAEGSQEMDVSLEESLKQSELTEKERGRIIKAMKVLTKEGKVKRGRVSLDMVMKELSISFKETFAQLLEGYKISSDQIECLIGRELISIKRIADVIFEIQDKEGNTFLLTVEFEAHYKSDKKMDRRMAEYQHLISMDKEFKRRKIKCNVFYVQSSPKDKPPIEERKNIYSPENNSDLKIEVAYRVFHLNKFDIPMILEKNLPFLLPLRQFMQKITREENEKYAKEIMEMLDSLHPEQLSIIKIIFAYFSEKHYNNTEEVTKNDIIMLNGIGFKNFGDTEAARVEGRVEGQREAMQKLFIQGSITYKVLKEILGEEEAMAIRDIRDKTKKASDKEER